MPTGRQRLGWRAPSGREPPPQSERVRRSRTRSSRYRDQPLRVLVVSLAVVVVMAADPELEPIVLVAAFRRPVKDRVVAHQELEPTPPGLIGLVDDPVFQGEGAEAGALRQIPDDVGAARAGIAVDDRRQEPEARACSSLIE